MVSTIRGKKKGKSITPASSPTAFPSAALQGKPRLKQNVMCQVTPDCIPREKAPLFHAREWMSIVPDERTGG